MSWIDAIKQKIKSSLENLGFSKTESPGAAAQKCDGNTSAPPTVTGLGPSVDALASQSPTLKSNIDTLQKGGWTIRYGDAGKGSYCNKDQKTIVIDSQFQNNSSVVTQILSHESGHALYTADPYVNETGRTKAEYVSLNANRHLKDEGEATLVNARVRQEILKSSGTDIGIAGSQTASYEKIISKYTSDKDRDKARQEIADIFADNEKPSGSPAGTTYRIYYSQSYSDHWDNVIAPKLKKP
ncbi:type VI secretion system secreted protein VgrG [Azospirillum oryzae]|uniref:Type VI secretion system secreted protein VgrG n=1 Tax=Azospirillum oryzae TaxID=286727 RepID=A0A1X7H646_9PROT|nr:hypothetical protein [Azospirillum oryzae]SMF80409.1 type VI secretion system secreted protein VgrG [Azospirillum oryzae]